MADVKRELRSSKRRREEIKHIDGSERGKVTRGSWFEGKKMGISLDSFTPSNLLGTLAGETGRVTAVQD